MQWWSLKQLKSASPRARLAAVEKLGREGETATIAALTELLRDEDGPVRAATARALGRIGVSEVISPLFARLQLEPELEVRRSIVKTLASLNLPETIPPLVGALLDPSGEVGWIAAQALKARRWEPADDTERAAMHLANTQFDAAIALGAAAIGPLIKVAQGVTFQRCIRAVEALAAVGGAQAVKPLLDCLRSEDFTVRSATVTALGEVGDGRALDPLIAALEDSHHQVVLAACVSLGKVGDKRAADPVIRTVQHQAPDVRTAAVETLGKLRDRKAVPVLVECLRDTDNYVREAAAVSLGSICDEESIEHLVVALTDREITVRQAAAAALSRIQPHWEQTEAALRAIPQLQSAIKDRDYWVRNSAADVLRKLGVTRDGDGPMITDSDCARKKRLAAHSILFFMLSDRDRIFRQAAAETLGRIGNSESVQHLVERLLDSDRGVKTAAARSLEILRWQTDVRSNKARQLVALERWAEAASLGDDAVDALVDVFAWKDALTRRRATETLVKIGSAGAVSALRTLASDANEAVREEATTALVALKSDSRGRQLSSSTR